MIIYLLFALPFVLLAYKHDYSKYRYVMMLNLLIGTFGVYLYSAEFKVIRYFMQQNKGEIFDTLYTNIGYVPGVVNYLAVNAYYVFAFIMTIIFWGLVIRSKFFYKTFKYIFPITVIFQMVFFHRRIHQSLNIKLSAEDLELFNIDIVAIVATLLTHIILFLIYWLIYRHKKFNSFFDFSLKEKIKLKTQTE